MGIRIKNYIQAVYLALAAGNPEFAEISAENAREFATTSSDRYILRETFRRIKDSKLNQSDRNQ